MKIFWQTIATAVLSLTLFAATSAQAAKELSDAEMDNVHAGDSAELDPGEGLVDPAVDSAHSLTIDNSTSSIALSGNAQQNLSSFVNVLAINSSVQVLMNVNVAIDSTIGSVAQDNLGQINP